MRVPGTSVIGAVMRKNSLVELIGRGDIRDKATDLIRGGAVIVGALRRSGIRFWVDTRLAQPSVRSAV